MICEFQAKAKVNPTEDVQKVIDSFNNIFKSSDMVIDENQIMISGHKDGLENLKESLEQRKVRETARKILIKGIHNNEIIFNLSKQAAYVGVPVILDSELSALGEIEVIVNCPNPQQFIDWIAPSQIEQIEK
ncbi:MAG: RNA-binding domain-containing protein [Methanomicrobiales archaeon]